MVYPGEILLIWKLCFKNITLSHVKNQTSKLYSMGTSTKITAVNAKGGTTTFAKQLWDRLPINKTDGGRNGWWEVTDITNPAASIPGKGGAAGTVNVPDSLKVIPKKKPGESAVPAELLISNEEQEQQIVERVKAAVDEQTKLITEKYAEQLKESSDRHDELSGKYTSLQEKSDVLNLRIENLTNFLIDKDLLTDPNQNPVEVVIAEIESKIEAEKNKVDPTDAEKQLKELADFLLSKGVTPTEGQTTSQAAIAALAQFKKFQ